VTRFRGGETRPGLDPECLDDPSREAREAEVDADAVFTLIEVVMVITIIGVPMALAIPTVVRARKGADANAMVPERGSAQP
jgi:prepilin-type N-terminal cleavage/methylation domain-containing protein